MIHRLYRFIFLATLILTTAPNANAALGVASPFSDHAVLQRDMPVPIWGDAEAGKEVTVSFRKQSKTAKADKDGKWHLKLDALDAGGPDELTISCGDEKIAVADVLVGEVWVGSGQSNMAGGAGGYAKRDATLANLLEAAPYPKIRLMKGGPKPTWQEADEKSVPGFSAILFAYGESLQRELDVPVGLIVGAVGGTPSGAWLSQEAYDSSDACKQSLAEFSKNFDAQKAQKAYEAKLAAWEKGVAGAEAKAQKAYQAKLAAWVSEAGAKTEKPEKPKVRKGRKPGPPAKPGQMTRGGVGNLYERFIRSVVGYGIRGVLWDQGESGTAIIGVDQYSVMGALISGWRREWGQGEFPFIFVQKPSGGGPAFAPKGEDQITREADAYQPPPAGVPQVNDGARRLEFIRIMDYPNAHMVSAADLGSGVHPINKWGYGNRAAHVAFAKVYGKDLLSHGPRYKSHKVEGDEIRVQFSHVGGGLVQAGGGEALTGFAIASEDKNFVWADAVIDGDSVVLSAQGVSNPVAVRFACSKKRNWANLFNKDGLPALAFRTDQW